MATSSRLLKYGAGAAVYAVGVGVAYEASRPIPKLPSCEERCCTFGNLAPRYDSEIELDESSSGILEMRREVGERASGAVLEVAGGTGRNLPYYTSAVDELLIGDYSQPMLQVAAQKVAQMRHAAAAAPPSSAEATTRRLPSKVTLAVLDACDLALPADSFDTVVDSFGLCSFERPVDALREMRRCVKPGGTVLLLEHGVSSWSAVAWWQRHRLNRHVVRWGCFWNRDILGLVEESGLLIDDVKRTQLGTLYLIRCRKPPAPPDGGSGR